jgi:hypothetical protein
MKVSNGRVVYEIVQSLDYLHVRCVKCRESSSLDFKGRDPTMVLVEITCPNCGSSGELKLFEAGYGFPRNKARRPRYKARRPKE